MADRPRLTTPRLRVVMDDGGEHEVQALNIDMLAFDRERAKRKWPTAQDAPFVWLTFLAWSAMRREGVVPDMSLSDFEAHALQVEAQDDDTVNPTKPEAAGE